MDGIEITPTSDPHSPSGVYLPIDLQDYFRELDRVFSASLIESIRSGNEDDLIQRQLWPGTMDAKQLGFVVSLVATETVL